MFRKLLVVAALFSCTSAAWAQTAGGCRAARTLSDIGLVSAGAIGVSAVTAVRGLDRDDWDGANGAAAALAVVAVPVTVATGIVTIPAGARCGHGGYGLMGGMGTFAAGMGAPLLFIGVGELVAPRDGYSEPGLSLALVGAGLALAAPGVVMNRFAYSRFELVDVAVLPQFGDAPGVRLVGRF